MYVDRKMEAVESRGAELRHRPIDRVPYVHADDDEPRLALARTDPMETQIRTGHHRRARNGRQPE
jgi:hypothetical protein